MPPVPSSLCGIPSISAGTNPRTLAPVELFSLADVAAQLPSPCGNLDDFELSRMRADSQALPADHHDPGVDVVVADEVLST